jgi:tRNA(Ile)-lysidine synthase
MFELQGTIPNIVGVACSGGVDSLVITHFLMQCRKRIVIMHYLWHNIEDSPGSFQAVIKFFETHAKNYPNLKLVFHKLPRPVDNTVNFETYYHRQRYKYFNNLSYPIITGHHLDDQVENWIMTSLTGIPKLIPYIKGNVIRPFLLVKKEQFLKYAQKHSVIYYTDMLNSDLKYRRNRIRHQVTPILHDIHPGLYTSIARLIRDSFSKENT